MPEPTSVFAQYVSKNYKFFYKGTLRVFEIHGGVPNHPKLVEDWIKTNLGVENPELLRAMVAETMVERKMTIDEATADVASRVTINGFKEDANGLYIEGRQLAGCLREAASIAANENRIKSGAKVWGAEDNQYKKGLTAWWPEHVGVPDRRLYLGVDKADGVSQRFLPPTFRSRGKSGIVREDYVERCYINFTVETDHAFTDEEWAAVWLTAERIGIGAARSQGYGRFVVTKWGRARR